jgi:dTDP-4-dehydrorhamnose reductase
MKILLFGYTGKLGNDIYLKLKKKNKIFLFNSKNINAKKINKNKLNNIINKYKPQIIINCLASQGIEKSQKNRTMFLKANAIFPKYLAQLQNKNSFFLIHFSSESIFNNSKRGQAIDEKIVPKPKNYYGYTKLLGENFVKKYGKNYLIIRLPLLYGGINRNQPLDIIHQKLVKNQEIYINNDLYTTPTNVSDVAKIILKVLSKKKIQLKRIVNVSNAGYIKFSRFIREYAKKMKSKSKIHLKNSKFFHKNNLRSLHTPLTTNYKEFKLRSWNKSLSEYLRKQI